MMFVVLTAVILFFGVLEADGYISKKTVCGNCGRGAAVFFGAPLALRRHRQLQLCRRLCPNRTVYPRFRPFISKTEGASFLHFQKHCQDVYRQLYPLLFCNIGVLYHGGFLFCISVFKNTCHRLHAFYVYGLLYLQHGGAEADSRNGIFNLRNGQNCKQKVFCRGGAHDNGLLFPCKLYYIFGGVFAVAAAVK